MPAAITIIRRFSWCCSLTRSAICTCLGIGLLSFSLCSVAATEFDQDPGRVHFSASPPVPVLSPSSVPVTVPVPVMVTAPVPTIDPPVEDSSVLQPVQIELEEAANTADGLIDINTATAEQLASSLPGIGPTKASRIVEWRETNGPFKVIDQLLEVPGIGPVTLERLRPLVRVGDAVAAAQRAKRVQLREERVRLAIGKIVARARSDAQNAR